MIKKGLNVTYNKTMQKTINFDVVAKENTREHYPNWLQILDHPYRILTIAGSGYGKTSSLFNLINQKPDIDKICLYAKDPYEAKYQFLITKRKDVGTKHFNDSKAFIEHSNNKNDLHKTIREYNPNKKRKILVVFDDMIADMLNDKKLNPIVTELFIKGRKLDYYTILLRCSQKC